MLIFSNIIIQLLKKCRNVRGFSTLRDERVAFAKALIVESEQSVGKIRDVLLNYKTKYYVLESTAALAMRCNSIILVVVLPNISKIVLIASQRESY